MDFEFRQPVLLLISVSLPLFLLWTRRERLLLGWVCATFFVQIFDTAIYTNLPAGRIVGILYLPLAVRQLKEWRNLEPVRAWGLNYIYLLVLAVAFGFLWPWPDITMMRGFSLTAPGRSIIYSARMLSDFSLAIFIATQLRRPGSLIYVGRSLVLGATVTAAAGLVHFITRLDLYYLITSLGEAGVKIERARGLSIEPRALGLACAYSVMILLLGRRRLFRLWPALLVLSLAGLLVTASTSSLIMLATGIITVSLFFSNRERVMVLVTLALSGALVLGASLYAPDKLQQAIDTIQLRLDPDYKLAGLPQGNFGQEVAYRLDVFDACALLFLLDQPEYALIGTGPGMVSLPASYYVPPGLYSAIWTPEQGINSPPSHGLLLEICNSGLLGLLLWLVQVGWCWRALRYATTHLADPVEKEDWVFGYSLFLIGSVFYLVQVSSSPVWSVFLAIGWVASRAVKLRAPQAQRAAVPRAFPQERWQPN